MEGYAVKPLILRSIGGHDVLLDAAYDLLDSIVESSGQHNRNLMGHALRRVWSLYEMDLDVIQICWSLFSRMECRRISRIPISKTLT